VVIFLQKNHQVGRENLFGCWKLFLDIVFGDSDKGTNGKCTEIINARIYLLTCNVL